jgi:hypothetical protein
MGTVYAKCGEYARALDAFARASAEHRAIGFRYGLTYWLEGSADALLELTESNDPMPEFLSTYLPDISEATLVRSGGWRAQALRLARDQAEECVAISREISKPDTLFAGCVLLARIDAAEDRRDVAVQSLHDLLQEAVDAEGSPGGDEQHAELQYWLWKLGEREQAATALALYETLYAKTPKYQYKQRIEELKAAGETP